MGKIFNMASDFISLLTNALSNPKTTVPLVPPTQIPSTTVVPIVPNVVVPDNSPFSIPPRILTMNGSDFGNTIFNVPANQAREDAIFNQCKSGNIPEFMRSPFEIVITSGSDVLKYYVLPDVLCIGTDEDYLRVPLNPLTAKKIGDLFNAILPTRKIATQIWQNADLKLNPDPNGPPYNSNMETTERFIFHNKKIETQRAHKPFKLISGHKKDIILSPQLFNHPNNVCIFGWFNANGSPIQGINPVSHDHFYKDYSHSERFISRSMILNDKPIDTYDVLKSPTLSHLINDEGAFDASKLYVS